VSQFRATKKFLLAESNEFGSKDVVMSIFYLTVGAACIVFTIIFGIVKFRRTREEEKEEEDSKKQSQGSENQNLD
jgi:fucose permease